jgi:hypothetical protein
MAMLVGILTALVSLGGAMVSAYYGYHLNQRDRAQAADELASRFREPLLQAAHNLQSRVYNIVGQDFLKRFYLAGEAVEHEREYAVINTVYLFAQYLGWVEIVRRESQYVDPRSEASSRAIVERLEAVRECLANSTDFPERHLRLFRGEQRAIGELMMQPVSNPSHGLPRWECRGYADFVGFRKSGDYQQWLARLEDDIDVLARSETSDPRLVELQHRLVDLVDVLDQGGQRVPVAYRMKL